MNETFPVQTFQWERLINLAWVFHSCHEFQLRCLSLHHFVVQPTQHPLIWASGIEKLSPCHSQLWPSCQLPKWKLSYYWILFLSTQRWLWCPSAPVWKPQIMKNNCVGLIIFLSRPTFLFYFLAVIYTQHTWRCQPIVSSPAVIISILMVTAVSLHFSFIIALALPTRNTPLSLGCRKS